MSEFGGRADVQQIPAIAVVINAVLPGSTKLGPLRPYKNAPRMNCCGLDILLTMSGFLKHGLISRVCPFIFSISVIEAAQLPR
jgi:hypothetical protein